MMQVLDLFSGIGAFSLGLERAGMQTVAFCEIDPYCRRVLAKHWPEIPCYDDVRFLTAGRLRADGIAVDIICGGFPCQDISVAGRGAGLAGEQSGLWSEFARLIGEIRPRYVLVENVAALLGRGLGDVLGDLAALGYDAEWHCIPASAVGAPHRRDRVWIVAYADSIGCGQGVADAGLAGLPLSERTILSGAWWRDEGRAVAERGWWRAEPDVCRMDDGPAARLDGNLDACSGLGSNYSSQSRDQVELRRVWCDLAAGAASSGRGSDEQLAQQLADALPRLSHALALAGGQNAMAAASCFLHRMWQACEALGAVRDTSQSLPQAWQSLSEQEAGRAFLAACGRTDWLHGEWLGVPRVAKGVASRVDRLRGLGNALVPQIPELIGRAILAQVAA